MIPDWIEYLYIFFLGTAIGSFLNVVIYRIPKGESIVFPASHCPNCKRKIKPYENIPIISYVSLKGRCAGCKKTISARYPLIETLMGCIALLLFNHYGWSFELLLFGALCAVLLALSAIDIETYRLPNKITLTGAIIALIITVVFFNDQTVMHLLGGVTGVGLMVFMWLVGRLIFRKETLGIGDIKLAGMIGLYIGPWFTIGMFTIGVFLGAIVGVVLIAIGGKKWGQRIPFGPYLAAGSLISILWGTELLHWYVSLAIR